MRNKPNPKDFIFSRKSGETLIKKPGEIRGYDFAIENLTNCAVYLLDRTAQITVDECTKCEFFVGPVEGSIFFRDCSDCKVSVSCQQLRTKNCHRIIFNAMVTSDPTIEDSDQLIFGPYNFAYPLFEQHISEAKLNFEDDHWSQIFDFNREEGVQHWAVQDPSQYKRESYPLEGFAEPSNPVPVHQRYGGVLTGPIPLGAQLAMGTADEGGMVPMPIDTTSAQGLMLKGDLFDDYPQQRDIRSTDPFAHSQSQDVFESSASGALATDPFASGAMAPDPFASGDRYQQMEEPEEEEDIDEDARARMRARELEVQEQMRALYEKDEAERSEKQARRSQAAEELRRWREERAKQTDQRKLYNRQQEEAFVEARKSFREGTQWKKVSSMIDFKESSERKELGRMRQVLLAKKNE